MKNRQLYILMLLVLVPLSLITQTDCTAETFKNSIVTNIKEAKSQGVTILVDIDEKTLYVVSGNMIVKEYPVASGKYNSPSPLGDFKIIEKLRSDKEFGAAWLGLDVPWGKYGIHGTDNPGSIGYSASHGCIRMLNKDVKELYKIVKVGTPVKIIGGMYGLFGHGYRTLTPGDRGSDVLMIQKKLKEQGYYEGKLNGVYGIRLEIALNKFQKANNLPITNKISHSLYRRLGLILME